MEQKFSVPDPSCPGVSDASGVLGSIRRLPIHSTCNRPTGHCWNLHGCSNHHRCSRSGVAMYGIGRQPERTIVGAMGEVPLVSQAERSPSARGTEALQSCFRRPGLLSMMTARRESWPLRRKKRRRKRRKNRGGEITPMLLRRSLFFVAPATPAGRMRCKPPAPATQPLRFTTIHETRNTAFMFFTRHESRNTNHGLWGRSVRRGCARVAQPETAVRTTAPAAQSLFPCSLLFTIVRHCSALFG